MKKKVYALTLILALFLSTVGSLLVGLAAANPMARLPAIIIKSDGSVEPQTTFIRQVGNFYTLTDDIVQSYSVRIQCSNIVFDGQGHVIEGISSLYGYSGNGLSVEGVRNVTIKNLEVKEFNMGFSIGYTNDSTILNIKTGILHLEHSYCNSISRINISRSDSTAYRELRIYNSDNNTIMECNFAAFSIGSSYHNLFFKNNIFHDDIFLSDCEISWDNGSVGNYWNNYNGADVNHDGLGDTPYIIKSHYSNDTSQDRFPLMHPWDPSKPIDRMPPSIIITSPQNKMYNDSSVALAISVSEPVSWMGYSLNGQDNVTVSGNSTLSGLPNGSHNITVYAIDVSGNTGASEIFYFNVDAPEPFPALPVAVAAIAVAAVAVGLMFYFKKRQKLI